MRLSAVPFSEWLLGCFLVSSGSHTVFQFTQYLPFSNNTAFWEYLCSRTRSDSLFFFFPHSALYILQNMLWFDLSVSRPQPIVNAVTKRGPSQGGEGSTCSSGRSSSANTSQRFKGRGSAVWHRTTIVLIHNHRTKLFTLLSFITTCAGFWFCLLFTDVIEIQTCLPTLRWHRFKKKRLKQCGTAHSW